MPKESYYKKQKRLHQEEVSNLYKDIRIIIGKSNSYEAIITAAKYQFKFDLEDAIWSGTTNKTENP